jgi:hypothetical protein
MTNMNKIGTYVVSVMLLSLALTCSAVGAAKATPAIQSVSPDVTYKIQPGHWVQVDEHYLGADLHCYNSDSGAPYVQHVSTVGYTWSTKQGKTTSVYDRVNHVFTNVNKRTVIVCASWAS